MEGLHKSDLFFDELTGEKTLELASEQEFYLDVNKKPVNLAVYNGLPASLIAKRQEQIKKSNTFFNYYYAESLLWKSLKTDAFKTRGEFYEFFTSLKGDALEQILELAKTIQTGSNPPPNKKKVKESKITRVIYWLMLALIANGIYQAMPTLHQLLSLLQAIVGYANGLI